jgi:glycosyl-4,4'-diaponeurosporenoate acyltransferase
MIDFSVTERGHGHFSCRQTAVIGNGVKYIIMRFIFLSDIGTAIFDIVAWICFHLGIGYWSSRLPLSRFDPQNPFYLTQKWERGGEIYQKIFHVRSWKKIIPSGAALYRNAFRLKSLPTYKLGYLETWLKESCRAEFCHWVMILPGFLFFIWNSVEVGWWMVAYAVANNLVPIVMQRYNRPRMRKMLAQLQKTIPQRQELYVNLESNQTLSNSYR